MRAFDQIQRLLRLHDLIRRQATGNAISLANRLNISRPTVYRYLDDLKDFGADIYYCRDRQSYCYNGNFILEFSGRLIE
ncbi:MAG: helix-turn-helix domain-containing protein [Bacteroidota bacterium]